MTIKIIEIISQKLDDIVKGSGFGKIEINIQNGRVVRIEKSESEMIK